MKQLLYPMRDFFLEMVQKHILKVKVMNLQDLELKLHNLMKTIL